MIHSRVSLHHTIIMYILSTFTGPDSSVGRASAPGNGKPLVRSRAATYQYRNGISCSPHGTQILWVEIGLVDPVSG